MAFAKNFVLGIALALAAVQAGFAQTGAVHLIPTPKEIAGLLGDFELKPTSRIVATTPEMLPLARVLSDEIRALTGLALPTTSGAPQSNDIVLKINGEFVPDGRYWPHTVDIEDQPVVSGSDYNAVAMGTATLLQLLKHEGKSVALPKLVLSDYSAAEFPGLMLDVARQNNSLADVRACVEMCRLYKVRYLQLHLNDMESFMFPSKLFPKLGTHNRAAHGGPKCEPWDRDELLATIKYADDRGVTLLPELETVFHTGAMMEDMPAEFGGPGVLNMGSEKLYESLDPLIEEMCDVFKSSPFFQIGCDEASIGGVLEQPGTKAYMAKHHLKDGNDLYRFHIDRLAKLIKAKGKRTIVWQDCPLPLDNKDIICMVWHIDFNHGDTANIMKAGYPTIQVTWTPSCSAPVKDLFGWRPFDEQIQPSKLAMGSQLVLWEQNGSVAIPYLRQKMPARQQFTYSPNSNLTYSQFLADLDHTDSLLDPLATGIIVKETGLKETTAAWLEAGGRGDTPPYTFAKSVEVSLTTHVAGARVHFTETPIKQFSPTNFYGKEPTASSEVAAGPIKISTPDGEAVAIEARLFDASGKPLGAVWRRVYRWEPYVLSVKNTVAPGDNRFGKSMTIELADAAPGGSVRYEIGKPLTAQSPQLDKSLTLDQSAEVNIGFFDGEGHQRGLQFHQSFRQVDFDPTNITYKKPVIQWGSSSKQAAEVCVDGIVDREQFLDIQPAPQEFAIDLEAVKNINKVVLYTYWDGGRFYQYKIDVSVDGKRWTNVVDASENNTVATEHGYAHTFAPQESRYLRATMLRNSANPGLHIVELRAYEAK